METSHKTIFRKSNSKPHSMAYFKDVPSVISPWLTQVPAKAAVCRILWQLTLQTDLLLPNSALQIAWFEKALCVTGFFFRDCNLAAISLLPTLRFALMVSQVLQECLRKKQAINKTLSCAEHEDGFSGFPSHPPRLCLSQGQIYNLFIHLSVNHKSQYSDFNTVAAQ